MLRALLIGGWLVFATFGEAAGQNTLLFQRGRYKKVFYRAGDVLLYRQRGEPGRYGGTIQRITDSTVFFADDSVLVRNISHLYPDIKLRQTYFLRYKYEALLPLAGGVYFLTDVLNARRVDQQTLIVTGVLVGAGGLARLLIPRTFKITRRNRLVVLNTPWQ